MSRDNLIRLASRGFSTRRALKIKISFLKSFVEAFFLLFKLHLRRASSLFGALLECYQQLEFLTSCFFSARGTVLMNRYELLTYAKMRS